MTQPPPSPALHVAVPRTAGLDVHKLRITASTRLCADQHSQPQCATREFASSPHGLTQLSDWLDSQQVDAVAMEGTGVYWEPVYAALESSGLDVSLYNAQQVKQLRGRKTDRKDAAWLACVCQFGLGAPSYIPPLAFRDLRAMTRQRRKLVADCSRARNRIQKLLERHGLPLGGVLSDICGRNGRLVLDGLAEGQPAEDILAGLSSHVQSKRSALAALLQAGFDDEARAPLRGQLRTCDHHSKLIGEQDQHIAAAVAAWQPQLDLLQTIPGIDRSSACAILAEIGPTPWQDFPQAAQLCAWAGVCPGNHESAGKRRSGRARKGNRSLRVTLAECAHGAVRTHGTQFASYHRTLTARKGYKRAILATAHKLLRTVYAVLRDQQHYRDPGIDYDHLWCSATRRAGWPNCASSAICRQRPRRPWQEFARRYSGP